LPDVIVKIRKTKISTGFIKTIKKTNILSHTPFVGSKMFSEKTSFSFSGVCFIVKSAFSGVCFIVKSAQI